MAEPDLIFLPPPEPVNPVKKRGRHATNPEYQFLGKTLYRRVLGYIQRKKKHALANQTLLEQHYQHLIDLTIEEWKSKQPKDSKQPNPQISETLTDETKKRLAADLQKDSLTDLSLFASVFFQQHVSSAFGSLHLTLLHDLRCLSMGKYVLPSTEASPATSSSPSLPSGGGGEASAVVSCNSLPSPDFSEQKTGERSALEVSRETESPKKDELEVLVCSTDSKENGPRPLASIFLKKESQKTESTEESTKDNAKLGEESQISEGVDGALLEEGELFDRYAVAAPRGHAKSTIVSMIYVVWNVVYKLHKFILLVSDSEDQAKLLLGAVRHELEENELLRHVYGDLTSEIWGELVLETANGVRIQCRGQGQRMRGMKHREERPGLVIIDDIESDEGVEVEERRTKLKRWFYGALIPCIKKGGKIVAIGTIMHEDGLLPELLKTWPSRTWGATKDGTLEGEPTWPAHFTTEDIKKLWKEYSDLGLGDVFWREHFNQIVSNEDALFPKEIFRYVTTEEMNERADKGEIFRTFMTVDPAIMATQHHDYTVFSIVHVDSRNVMYVVEFLRGRWPITETVNRWFLLLEQYSFSGIGIQKPDWERIFKVPMQAEMKRRNKFFRVQELSAYSSLQRGMANKEARIQRLAPKYRGGEIVHLKGGKNINILEDELLKFPRSRYDDTMDSLAMQLDLIFPPSEKKEKKFPSWMRDSGGISGYGL